MKSLLLDHQPLPSPDRRRILQLAGGGMLALCLTPGFAHAQAAAWQQNARIRELVGDAPVSVTGLQITLPLVAEDGSSVPLTITSDPGTPAQRIKQLRIFALNNPTPEVAVFDFGPEIENVNLATRIRLSESQTVVAIGHREDGSVLVAERAVRVTASGCIAPARSDRATEMQARVRVPDTWAPDQAGEVLTMISHPMITGLAQDADGNTPEARIIEQFEATLNGEPVLSATFFRSLAANPYLKFGVTLKQEGEIRFQWTETGGRQVEHAQRIRIA